jgi:hypothetical protein
MAKKSLKDMKFDAVVMNQPYGGRNGKEVDFINKAKEIADEVICICPTHHVKRREVSGIVSADYYWGNELFNTDHGAVAILKIHKGYQGDIKVNVNGDLPRLDKREFTVPSVNELVYNHDSFLIGKKLQELDCEKVIDVAVTQDKLIDGKFVVALSKQFINSSSSVYPQHKGGSLKTSEEAKVEKVVGDNNYIMFDTMEEAEEYYNFLKDTKELHDALYHITNSGNMSKVITSALCTDINKMKEVLGVS